MSGPGSLLSFTVRGGFDRAVHLMKNVQLITPAVSLGSVDSLIQHPAGLTHRNSSIERNNHDSLITDSMLRLSVGIEHVEDLWDDLQNAL